MGVALLLLVVVVVVVVAVAVAVAVEAVRLLVNKYFSITLNLMA